MFGAFYECTTLEELYVGNGITDLSDIDNTLGGCKSLKHLYLGNNIEKLQLSMDDKLPKLEDVVITSSKIRELIESPKNSDGAKIYLPQKICIPMI